MTDDRATAVLTSALRNHVAEVDYAGNVVVDVARRRHAQRARRAVAGTVSGVVLVMSVAVAAGSLQERQTAPPTTTASATATATPGPGGVLPVDVTYLPPGYRYLDGERDLVPAPEGDGTIESSRANYGRERDGALVIVATMQAEGLPPATLEDYAGQRAKEIRIGGRTVIRVVAGGMPFYVWNEAPGLSVSVEGRGGTRDADVRAIIAGIRRRS